MGQNKCNYCGGRVAATYGEVCERCNQVVRQLDNFLRFSSGRAFVQRALETAFKNNPSHSDSKAV